MADITCITGCRQGPGNGGVVELLIDPQFVPARDPCGVKVGEIINISADSRDHISLHDLHVVDVIEELEAGMANLPAEVHTPVGIVTLVVRVIYLRIQQFHDQDDIMLFGEGQNPLKSEGALIYSVLIGEPLTVSAEGDDVRDAGFRRCRNKIPVDFEQDLVVLPAIEGPLNATQSTVVLRGGGNRARQSEGTNGGNLIGVKKVDTLESDLCGTFGKGLESEISEAPAADGLVIRHERGGEFSPVSARDGKTREGDR